MARRKLKVKGPKGKLRTRNMYDGIQGTTVRLLDAKSLPTGCCVLRNGIPCVFRMTHIDVKVERMWMPSEQAEVPVVKVLGYCKSHRPRNLEVIALGADLEKQLNGPRTQKARMRRMEDAQYVSVVPSGGTVKHKVLRTDIVNFFKDGRSSHEVDSACGRTMKKSNIVGNNHDGKDCPKCEAAIRVIT